ncbi:MAG TPA: response regulator transcription factor [Solirubrobacterales bacterium]|nr:response regulator transcription factor [Solirubrobacterales bacterium]
MGDAPAASSVLLIDEEAILRRAVRGLLEDGGLDVVGEADEVEAGLTMAVALQPDVITMALAMRSGSGIEATRSVLKAIPAARVVILTKSTDPAHATAAIGAGACGYLLKDDPPEDIVAGIRVAAGGASPLSPRVAAELLDFLRLGFGGSSAPELTAREREVLGLLAEGGSNAEIAAALSISVPTVKRHLSHLLVKLGASNRTQAAVEAVRRGLL